MTRKFNLFLVILAVFTLFMSVIPVNAASPEASPSKREVVFQEDVITDEKVLFEKAKKEKKNGNNGNEKKMLKAALSGDGGEVDVEVLSTTQLIEVANVDGNTEEVYTTTYSAEPTEEAFDEVTTQSTSTQTKSGTYHDTQGYAVRGAATLTYTVTTLPDRRKLAKLNSVKGSWTLLDSGFSLSNRWYQYGNSGINASNYPDNQRTAIKYTTSNSFLSYAPTSWDQINMVTNWHCGVTMNVNVSRGSSTYSFKFNHDTVTY